MDTFWFHPKSLTDKSISDACVVHDVPKVCVTEGLKPVANFKGRVTGFLLSLWAVFYFIFAVDFTVAVAQVHDFIEIFAFASSVFFTQFQHGVFHPV